MKKRGFELSVTVIVLLIISIVIFGFGIYFIKQFFTATEKIQTELSAQTQREIQQRMATGELVSIPLNKRELRIGDAHAFGLGVSNILDEQDFFVKVNFNKAFRFERDEIVEAEQDYIDNNWIFTSYPPIHLKKNENSIVPIKVQIEGKMSAQDKTKAGTYIFNVCVFRSSTTRDCRLEEDETIGAFQQSLYTNRMYKIYIEVI